MIGGTLDRKPTRGGPKKPLWPTESTFDKCKKKATEWDENRKHRDRLNGFLMGGTWDDAQKTIDRFERAVELIEKFPVKSIYHKPEPTKWTAGGTLDGGWYPV